MSKAESQGRTERPTPKRLDEARREGRVARSPDVSAWSLFLVASFVVPWFVSFASGRVEQVLALAVDTGRRPTPAGALIVLEAGLKTFVETVLPLGAVFVALALVLGFAQVGRAVSLSALKPKFSHLNPATGVRRLFSTDSLSAAGFQLLKVLPIGVVGYLSVRSVMRAVPATTPTTIAEVIGFGVAPILQFIRIVAIAGTLLGVTQYFISRKKLMDSLKMTKQEVKDEMRAAEGDPRVKGEVRKRMYRIARRRVVAAVRDADVVVVNPTHFSVALRYDPDGSGAPRVLAKGAGEVALKMREEATLCGVPVIEDPPLARYLWAVCEEGAQIPSDIYLAVARLLAFVYQMRDHERRVTVTNRPHSDVPTTWMEDGSVPAGRVARVRG